MNYSIRRGCPVGKKAKKKAKAKRIERETQRKCAEEPNCTHPLLEIPDNLELGRTLTIEDIHLEFVVPDLAEKRRRPSTLRGINRDVRRWSQWWASQNAGAPLPVGLIRRKHLELFRSWIGEMGGSVALQNSSVRSIIQVLRAAVRHEIITHAPTLEALHHRGIAPKVYPSNEELDRIWEACKDARWPRRTSTGAKLPYSPAVAWRVALVIFRTYGLRTQELVRLESQYRSLTWANIHGPGITPNPEGRMESATGWLRYTPQKQERVKPEPLVLALTKHTRAALDLVAPEEIDPAANVLDWPLSAEGFYDQWHRLLESAGVKPRETSGVERYTPKHLRKAATTEINKHRPGMAEYIVGHSSDRSGTGSIVSARHYNNAEEAVCECLATLPMPQSFDEVLEGFDEAA